MKTFWGLVGSLWAAASLATAGPAEDHERGLKAYQRGDVVAAMNALRPAARAGHAPAQALLAFVLERADELGEAVALYRAAAEQGNVDAHAGLASLLVAGRGVAKDEKLALEHFSKAAALGHRHSAEVAAQAWLDRRLGADAERDPLAAREAVLRAAELGHLPSADAMADAYRSGRFGLTPDPAQAERWQQRARAWRQERAPAARPAK